MTIPSIGGNGDSLNKIHINPQPAAPAAVQPVPIPQPQSVEMPTPQPEAQTPDIAPSENTVKTTVELEKEKEYSIEQFKKDYAQLVEEKVLPVLQEFEGERKKRLTGAICSAIVLAIGAICAFLFVEGRAGGELFWGCIGGIWVVWAWIKKSFEHKVKRLIMPTLMRAVPGFYWQETPPVTEKDIKQCMIIPFVDRCSKTFDDCFVGEYRKVKVAISECEYSMKSGNSETTILQGVVIRIKMNKDFDGITIIRPKKPGYRDKYDDLKRAKLSEVKLEDPEFDKKFVVYSTDQIEARYLITTSFMERFKQVEDAFTSKFAYCSFYGDSVYIAPHTGCDLFNLCSLVKPIGNREQFETLFYEFVSVLALVDHFKLDKKLGL